MHRFTAVVLVTLVAALPQGSAEGFSAAPLDVEATVVGDTAIVTWVPSPSAAGSDVSYRIYGETEGGLVFLAEVPPATNAVVDGFYLGYAVSAVVSGSESVPTGSRNGPCIWTAPGEVPPVTVHDCGMILTVRKP